MAISREIFLSFENEINQIDRTTQIHQNMKPTYSHPLRYN